MSKCPGWRQLSAWGWGVITPSKLYQNLANNRHIQKYTNKTSTISKVKMYKWSSHTRSIWHQSAYSLRAGRTNVLLSCVAAADHTHALTIWLHCKWILETCRGQEIKTRANENSSGCLTGFEREKVKDHWPQFQHQGFSQQYVLRLSSTGLWKSSDLTVYIVEQEREAPLLVM